MNAGSNRRGSNEEIVFSEIGQVGTQFDGFTHQTIGDSLYNCVKVADVATRSGFTKLGIEHVGSLITRGVLIDVAALKGVSDAARHLSHHGRRPAAGAAAAEADAAARATPSSSTRAGAVCGTRMARAI